MSDAPEIPDGYAHLLEQPYLGHLGTIRPDGSPQVNTMWFGWDGKFVRFPTGAYYAKH